MVLVFMGKLAPARSCYNNVSSDGKLLAITMSFMALVGAITLAGCVGIATRAVNGASVVPATSAAVAITPSVPPAVNQGTTFQFTANAAGTWSCSGTDSTGAPSPCAGSIDSTTGLYTAPATVKAQQSYGGFQVLPNNHIFNTRVDSLPVNPHSAAWIAGAGTVAVNYLPSFPINYIDDTTPTAVQHFYYSPGNDGVFQMPQYPDAKVEGGWFASNLLGDKHWPSIDTTNGIFQEMYQSLISAPAGQPVFSPCPTCTADSGVRYASSTYDLPTKGSTDAAGLYLMPLVLRLQEVEQALASGGTINHALRMTLNQGFCASSNIWPAQTFATDGGVVPFGARFRLKSGFDISKFSPVAKILLTQLKQYGLILADGGYGWQINVENTRWPSSIDNIYNQAGAFAEIAAANIGPSNFEAVDESGLMLSPSSGETTHNREIISFIRTSDSVTASVDVVLTGVTVNLPKDVLYIQAGTAAQQFTAFVHGTNDTTLTWTMSPSIGTLTTGGLYTPPTTLGSVTAVTVTATSVANPSVAASMVVTIFPPGTIRIVNGQTTPYTDSSGNVWAPWTGDDNGSPFSQGGSFPSTPDMTLYKTPFYAADHTNQDIRFDFSVPNGSYQITAKFLSNLIGAGHLESLEVQGQILQPNLDVFVAAGGNNIPIDIVLPAIVTGDKLSFVVRAISGHLTYISALEIAPVP